MAMEKGTKFTQIPDDVYIAAIRKFHGNLSAVARELNVSRNTVASKVKLNPEIQQIVDDERDSFVDLAEDRLYGCVERNSVPAIMFTLKTIGKVRGWGENQEIILKKEQDEEEYDLSQLTEKELEILNELTAKIYKPKSTEEKASHR